jgi:hypothetical protein
MTDLSEIVLSNDYPVYAGHVYVADGKPIVSDVFGTVADLKRDTKAQEIKSCDLSGRGLL